jgi:hypothetical protein
LPPLADGSEIWGSSEFF